jgi:hypothetical protein
MKIPDRVNVCGISAEVIKKDHTYDDGRYSWGGYFDAISHEIILYTRYAHMANDGITSIITRPHNENCKSFCHELWHLLTSDYSFADTTKSEFSSEMFSTVATKVKQGNGWLDLDNDIMDIFSEFKSLVTEIEENDYRKIEYFIKNTHFEYDNPEGATVVDKQEPIEETEAAESYLEKWSAGR